jgi:hypothetical protein
LQKKTSGSTGPRTKTGKARSSRNATKHGITSLVPVLPGESKTAWEAHRDAFMAELAPGERGGIRAFLAERAATIAWRIRRLERYETTRLTADIEKIEESKTRARISTEYPFTVEQKLEEAEFNQKGLQRFIDAVNAGETDSSDADTLFVVESVLRDEEKRVFPEGIPPQLLPENLSPEHWNNPPQEEAEDDPAPYSAEQLLAIVNVIASMDILRQKLFVFRKIVTECKAELAKREKEIRRRKEQSTLALFMVENVARYETHLSKQLMGTLKTLGWGTETPP